MGGYPIYAPSKLLETDYDCIVISSMYLSEIRQQLLEMGVPEAKILSPAREERLEDIFPWDVVIFGACLMILSCLCLLIGFSLA